MTILNPLRGTGRRRAVDALAAARNSLRTYEAACTELQDERDDIARQLAALREEHAYQARALAQAREENTELRHALHEHERAAAEAKRERAALEAENTALRADLANARAVHVPAPADAGCRLEAAAEATAPWDVSALRAEEEDGPRVHALLPADDDTVTLPVPATAPAPEVHDADEPTRPVATLAALRMATPVRPLRGSTSHTTVPVRTLADMTTGGDAA